jgi:hypothetical protein
VRIRLVAIHAFLERQWSLEVAAGMALHTLHSGVLSQQGIFCF